jgi:predicted ribosome quality control (RQC) complex YloA/Tae2 family protein
MQLIIDIKKNVNQNAADYFEKGKKSKRKMQGAIKALEQSKAKLEELQQKKEEFMKQEQEKQEKEKQRKEIKREWYEKFRWFISSEDILVIGGRDATSNEIIIKKHTMPDETVFHTESAGSPFVVIKGNATDKTIQEAAQFCASYSKAWKIGVSSTQVYSIKGEQVSKEAKSGEYIPKGGFMVYGERKYHNPRLELAIGNYEGRVMAGPVSAISKHCERYVVIVQGDEKASSMAKFIQKKIDCDLDEIIRAIPAGSKIKTK